MHIELVNIVSGRSDIHYPSGLCELNLLSSTATVIGKLAAYHQEYVLFVEIITNLVVRMK